MVAELILPYTVKAGGLHVSALKCPQSCAQNIAHTRSLNMSSLESCIETSKKMYTSYQHAEYDACAITKTKPAVRKQSTYSVYRCRFCQSWHVGSLLKEKPDSKPRSKPSRWRFDGQIANALAG
jgi:hypothetical protein